MTRATTILSLVTVLAIGGCERPNGFEPIGAITMTVVHGGTAQSAPVNTAVATPPEVVVRNADGEPVAGIIVSFFIATGGGSLSFDPSATGPDGRAKVVSWTLGPNPGANKLVAFVRNATSVPMIEFNATGTP